jgi:hypothetical protein
MGSAENIVVGTMTAGGMRVEGFLCAAVVGAGGAFLGALSRAIQKFDNVKAGLITGAALGVFGGGIAGAIDGYGVASETWHRNNTSSFKASALKTSTPTSSPVLPTIENGNPGAFYRLEI